MELLAASRLEQNLRIQYEAACRDMSSFFTKYDVCGFQEGCRKCSVYAYKHSASACCTQHLWSNDTITCPLFDSTTKKCTTMNLSCKFFMCEGARENLATKKIDPEDSLSKIYEKYPLLQLLPAQYYFSTIDGHIYGISRMTAIANLYEKDSIRFSMHVRIRDTKSRRITLKRTLSTPISTDEFMKKLYGGSNTIHIDRSDRTFVEIFYKFYRSSMEDRGIW